MQNNTERNFRRILLRRIYNAYYQTRIFVFKITYFDVISQEKINDFSLLTQFNMAAMKI